MSEETVARVAPAEMTREQIQTEIANIDQIARQNSYKYEKRQRGDFPDGKWERFVASQNEMFDYRAELEAELESRDAEEPDEDEDEGDQGVQSAVYDFTGMTAAEVLRSLSYRPTKDELHQACDWLQILYTPTMTNAELKALIEATAGAQASE